MTMMSPAVMETAVAAAVVPSLLSGNTPGGEVRIREGVGPEAAEVDGSGLPSGLFEWKSKDCVDSDKMGET